MTTKSNTLELAVDTWPRSRLFNRDKISEQFLINTVSGVSIIKPTCKEFLKPDLDQHTLTVNDSPIADPESMAFEANRLSVSCCHCE